MRNRDLIRPGILGLSFDGTTGVEQGGFGMDRVGRWVCGVAKEGEPELDISLSVDRKLKLPVGSNEISNYPWDSISL